MKHERLLYAHRGAAAELPENTLAAFRRALDIGADALEMDAHRTADGHIVIAHDPDGMRMCGVDKAIRETTLARLKTWDAGFGFVDEGEHPHADRGHTIPTLAEVLEEFPSTRINVDLKGGGQAMVVDTIAEVRRCRAEDRVTLASFHWRSLIKARRLGYRGPTSAARAQLALLLMGPNPLAQRWARSTQAAQIPLRFGPIKLGTRRVVARLHQLGLRVDFWTINDAHTAASLLALGADGIMTDDPRTVMALFGKRRADPDEPAKSGASALPRSER